jgi:uroporphyrinogen III methyltransferase/synthase
MTTDGKKATGRVSLVGAGPGDPGLLTLRGARLLSEADVVVYDHLIAGEILSHVREGATLRYAGKEGGRHTLSQDEINRIIVEEARAGKRVVRLKGGDPFVFGRGGEEAEQLARAGIPFEVVPGVSSGSAVPAYAGIPVTHRGRASMVVFVTGHEDPTKGDESVDWEWLARFTGTIVVLMGVKRIRENVDALIAGGKSPDTPCAVISHGTTPSQRKVACALSEAAALVEREGVTPPAVMVIGEVVPLAQELGWFERLPLFGKRVVVTRARHQAGGLSARLLDLGATPIELPTIEIVPAADTDEPAAAVRSVSAYDIVVFTSPNGVDAFFREVAGAGKDARVLGGATVAAMGPGTAEALGAHGIVPDIVPDRYIAEALAEKIIEAGVGNKNVLLFRAEGARDVLPRLLTEAGAAVMDVGAYRSAVPDVSDEAFKTTFSGADIVTFASGSAAKNLKEMIDAKRRGGAVDFSSIALPPAASIGPITTDAAREAGFEVVCEADEHTIDGLVVGLIDYFAKEK